MCILCWFLAAFNYLNKQFLGDPREKTTKLGTEAHYMIHSLTITLKFKRLASPNKHLAKIHAGTLVPDLFGFSPRKVNNVLSLLLKLSKQLRHRNISMHEVTWIAACGSFLRSSCRYYNSSRSLWSWGILLIQLTSITVLQDRFWYPRYRDFWLYETINSCSRRSS